MAGRKQAFNFFRSGGAHPAAALLSEHNALFIQKSRNDIASEPGLCHYVRGLPEAHETCVLSEGTDGGNAHGRRRVINMRARSLWPFVAGWLVLAGALLAAPHPVAAGRLTAQPTGPGIRPIAVDLGTLGGEYSHGQAINNRGQIVGWSMTSSGAQHAFVAENNVMADLGPASGGGYVDLINARGQVLVNRTTDKFMARASLWDRGTTTDLPTLGGDQVEAVAINDAGQIAGNSSVATGEEHAFLWDNGVMTDLGTLDRRISHATAINEAGEVVGHVEDSAGSTRAFFWANGVMTDLGTLGGTDSLAAAINDAGQVVGSASTLSPGLAHAFLWADGVMTDLDPLSTAWSFATGINAAGQVIGQRRVTPDAGLRAFIWQDGVLTDLGTLGGQFSFPSAINAAGEVAGVSETAGGAAHAFLWKDGVMTDLGTLNGAGSRATAINDAGDVTGFALTGEGKTHAVLWLRAGKGHRAFLAQVAR